ncbi:MAG: Do family serine endopeptidase [candidate division Zixibacteria bacterium]
MTFWSQIKNVVWVLGIGGIFMLAGLIIGSDITIPEKLTADDSMDKNERSPASIEEVMPVSGHSPFVYVAEHVKPAVVNISAESITEDKYHAFMNDDFFKRFFGLPDDEQRKQPRLRKSESLGSGFIFSDDGYILTNNHVVEDAEKVTVTLSDQHRYKATIVGADKETDLAILKIEADQKLPIIKLGDSDSILVGDWVMAIGNPFPQLGLDRTVTVGVVSAKGRKGLIFGGDMPAYQNYIQTDASINPGNSGGPLVNLRGEAVGVNSAIASPSGGNVGIGFAIPINLARQVSDQLRESGVVSRGYLGIYPQDISHELKEANELPSTDGILVAQVDKGTPADKGGLKVGDVIVKFNDKKILDAQQFRFLVADAGPRSDVDMNIWRNGDYKNLKIRLGDRSEFVTARVPEGGDAVEDQRWLGLEVETPDKTNTERYGLDPVPGALVVSVEPGSPADDGGLFVGDIILTIGGRDIEDAYDFYDAADDFKASSKPISFYISRGAQKIFVAISPEE